MSIAAYLYRDSTDFFLLRRTARFPGLSHKIELFKVLNYHAVVIVGLVLVMMGVLNETKEAIPTPNTAMKVGVLIMSTGWTILVIWAALSLRQPDQNPMTIPAFDDATMVSICASLSSIRLN